MLAAGSYEWKGNNRYGDNHRRLTIASSKDGFSFELHTTHSAGPQGSNGSTLRGRVEPAGDGRFTLVAATDESWVHDDDNWSEARPSTVRHQLVVHESWCRPEVDIDGEVYTRDTPKHLLNHPDGDEIVGRLRKLTPTTPRRWGRMDVAQMLTHVHRALKTATGELKLGRSFIGFLFGRLAKKKLLSDQPWSQNLPTDRNFVVTDARDFDAEMRALLATIGHFRNAGPAGVSKNPHPFFGPLTPEEWGILMYRHFDHHLRQFGV